MHIFRFNNVYTSRGKIGFAIVKIQKTSDHNIVLYDSNKTTLSCTTISTKLEVTIKNNTYISYYDNLRKYWSIYGTEEEVKKVTDILTSFEVNINYSTYTDQCPPEPANVDTKTNDTLVQREKIDKGSDTDSSINRKTKASILNRMAHMGHSVLPTRTQSVERTSDSSDTMEVETQSKSVRHKPLKSIIKRNNVENIMPESQHLSEARQKIVPVDSVGNVPVYTSHNGQLLPLTSTNVFTSPSNELGMFISEQRISNSELRINMNRITDKVDLVLDKINNFDQKKITNIQTDILLKLLTEYENKIKIYEDLLKSNGDTKLIENMNTSSPANNNKEVEILKNKLSEYEQINQEKIDEISNLQDQIKVLKNKHAEDKLTQANIENDLLKKLSSLENNLKTKDEELANMANKYEILSATNVNEDNTEDKVKNIMNDTFQTISVNFDNNENYSGETVKKIIATVIKKITIRTLSEL